MTYIQPRTGLGHFTEGRTVSDTPDEKNDSKPQMNQKSGPTEGLPPAAPPPEGCGKKLRHSF